MGKIHEFDPQIYPFMLWVAANPSLKDVTRMLYFLDQNRDVITPTQADLDGCGDSDSRTFEVASKTTNREGYFVNLIKLKHCDSSSLRMRLVMWQTALQRGSASLHAPL